MGVAFSGAEGRMTDVQAAVASANYVIEAARAGRMHKLELAEFLNPAARTTFLNYCAAIERRYTEACTAKHDPCLEGGCALEGEICLQPLERASEEYDRACGNAFVELYLDPLNRV
jgi:hypothetical protein